MQVGGLWNDKGWKKILCTLKQQKQQQQQQRQQQQQQQQQKKNEKKCLGLKIVLILSKSSVDTLVFAFSS